MDQLNSKGMDRLKTSLTVHTVVLILILFFSVLTMFSLLFQVRQKFITMTEQFRQFSTNKTLYL